MAPKDAYNLRKKIFHEYIGSDKLEAILTSMVGCDAFDRFLRVDNPKDGTVNFIQDVSFFKKLGSSADERTKAAANKIYEAYFVDGAPKELPISEIMRDKMAVEMQGPDYYTVLFDPCVGELRHRLITQRIFKKFKECTLYVKYRMMIQSRHCDQVSSGSSMRESSLRDHTSGASSKPSTRAS